MNTTAAEALASLSDVIPNAYEESPGQWRGQCPAHESESNRKDNFAFSWGDEGFLLAHCKAGCEWPAIRDALVGLGVAAEWLSAAPETRWPGLVGQDPAGDAFQRFWDQAYRFLWSKEGRVKRTRLAKIRGLDTETLKEARIGWSRRQNAYTVPIWSAEPGSPVVAVKLYRPDQKQGDKPPRHQYLKGGATKRLYAPHGVYTGGPVLLCAGEWDALAACQAGFNAVTFIGGEGAVPGDDVLSVFKGCDVVVAYDNDRAGRQGNDKVGRSLLAAGARLVRAIDMERMGVGDKGDVSDVLNDPDLGPGALRAAVHLAQTVADASQGKRLRDKTDELWLAHEAKALFQSELAIRRQAASTKPRRVSGGEFFLDIPKDPPVLWGDGSRILWVDGEPLMLCGDDGTGKSTIDHQLIAMRLGLLPTDQLLGYAVAEAKGRVLYLAMDRPEQARRAGGRLFPALFAEEKFRDVLNERLVVWRGPLPVDPLSSPDALADWLHNEFGSDLSEVHADSLKDIAPRLTDDAVGSGLNTAIQEVISRGVNWVGLHHQRKANNENKRPEQLSDVYGSRWITAGHGSVLMLVKASEENKDYVELRQLKEPMDRIPALLLKHDRATGRTHEVEVSQDPELILNEFGDEGVTVIKAASLMFKTPESELTDALRKKAERTLKRYVERGQARYEPGAKGGAGGSTAGRYVRVEVA